MFEDLKEAHKRGAKIQFYYPCEDRWEDCETPGWFYHLCYRIKPESDQWDVEPVGHRISSPTEIAYHKSESLYTQQSEIRFPRAAENPHGWVLKSRFLREVYDRQKNGMMRISMEELENILLAAEEVMKEYRESE